MSGVASGDGGRPGSDPANDAGGGSRLTAVRRLGSWIARHRALAAFAAGILLTLAAVAIVGYFVLADQRRSARVLALALTQALNREVQIERVSDISPSRVVLHGLRLPAGSGWPMDLKAQSVEATGALLAATRGEAAPVRLLVTRPTVAIGGGGAGAAALDGLRQGLASFLETATPLDVAMTGGVITSGDAVAKDVTFDLTLRKGAKEAHGEIALRNRARDTFTLRLTARSEGDTVRLVLAGDGRVEPLTPWLPPTLVRAVGARPVDLRAQLGVEPGDRIAGRTSAELGDLVAIEGMLSLADGLLRLTGIRAAADLGFAGAVAGLPDPIQGRAELSDGELSWTPAKGGWPQARGVLRVPGTALPASTAGVDVRLRGLETPLALEPREGGAAVRGELKGERIELAGVALAPVATPWRVDLDAAGGVSKVELAGLTARALGAPIRATVAYDAVRARADARLEADGVPLHNLVRERWPGWLGPTDQLHAGGVRVVVAGLDPRGWSDGRVDAEVRTLALKQPQGEAAVDLGRVRATVQSGRATIGLEAQRLRGTLPRFDGLLPRVEGSAEVVRDGAGVSLARAALVARDGEGREMLQGDVRPTPGAAGPVRLTARLPALERLAPLWPSVPRQVTGSATIDLQAPDLGFDAYDGKVVLQVPGAELLGGRLSLRDVSVDVPLRRGKSAATAGPASGGSLAVGELIGYGVVLHDLTGRARIVDERLALDDLRYALYSGAGPGDARARDGPCRADGAWPAHGRERADRGVHGGLRDPWRHDDRSHAVRSSHALRGRPSGSGRRLSGTGGGHRHDRAPGPFPLVRGRRSERRREAGSREPPGLRLQVGRRDGPDGLRRHPGEREPPGAAAVRYLPATREGDQRARHADRFPGAAVPQPMRTREGSGLEGLRTRYWTGGARWVVPAMLAMFLGACVPVTVNITFPQEQLDAAARKIEDMPAQAATTPPPAPPAPAPGGGRTVDVTPRVETQSPEVIQANTSRRERRPAVREWKNRGCMGETNQGTLVARPGDGCGQEVATLIRAENADRRIIYDAFMKENNIPAADKPRVNSAFAKARQERSRPNDWVQLDNGEWVRKP